MNNLLKWCLLLLVMTALSTTVSFAQDDDDGGVLMEEGFVRGSDGFNIKQRLFIIGTAGFGIAGNQLNLEFSPGLGVRVTDRFHAGAGFIYNNVSVRDVNVDLTINNQDFTFGGDYVTSSVGFRLFSKFLIINFDALGSGRVREPGEPLGGVYAVAGFERLYSTVKFKSDDLATRFPTIEQPIKEKSNFNNLNIGIGYQQNFYRGVDYFFEVVYNVLWDEDTSNNPWPITPRAGFYYGF